MKTFVVETPYYCNYCTCICLLCICSIIIAADYKLHTCMRDMVITWMEQLVGHLATYMYICIHNCKKTVHESPRQTVITIYVNAKT